MALLPAGKYRGTPVEAALSTTSKGTLQVAVRFSLVDPPGQTITWYGFLSDAAIERTLESLRHCGWMGTDVREFIADRPLPEGFNQEVELVVEHETYEFTDQFGNKQSKVQARVQWINAGGGMAVKNALTEQEAAAFAEKLSRQIAALDRAAGRKVTPPAGGAKPAAAAQPPRAAAPRPAPTPQRAPVEQPDPDEATRQQLLEQQSQTEDVPY